MNIQEFAMTCPKDTEVVLFTKTEVKMNKKDVATKQIANPHGKIYKAAQIKVVLNASYEERVNDQLTAEGKEATFTAEDRKYGVKVGNSVLEKDGTFYITCIEIGKVGNTHYVTEDNKEIPYDEFSAFVPVRKPSGHQGVDKEVKCRNYKVDSIAGFEVS